MLAVIADGPLAASRPPTASTPSDFRRRSARRLHILLSTLYDRVEAPEPLSITGRIDARVRADIGRAPVLVGERYGWSAPVGTLGAVHQSAIGPGAEQGRAKPRFGVPAGVTDTHARCARMQDCGDGVPALSR